MTAGEPQKGYTLTLDSNPSTHRVVEDFTGMTSFPFTSCNEFLAQARYHKPNAVFVDLHIERSLGGLDLIPKLRAFYPHVPILVLGYAADVNLLQVFALGANDFIAKPLTKNDVVGRLYRRMIDAKTAIKSNPVLEWGDIQLAVDQKLVVCPEQHQQTILSTAPFNILKDLVSADGSVVHRNDLVKAGWSGLTVSGNALDQQVHTIRRELQAISSKVQLRTIYGTGFQLQFSPT